ncbi:MAG: citramalate synthase [Spirochaetes bacterium]|nr:citramalate synthase [Spirochaetota bacterium]
MKRVEIFDTTLRDGMQGIEVSFSLSDKIQIAHKLDELGVDYIEGGFPLSNQKEEAFFELIKKETFEHAKIAAFGSTRKPNHKAKEDAHIRALLEAETEVVVVVGKTWKAHVEKVLRTSLEENLEMIYDSISYLKDQGRKVIFDLEHFFDGYKDDPAYALKVLSTGTEAKADCLVLCDTNGGTLPSEVQKILAALPQDRLAPLGVHFHNDTGNAVANSLLAIEAGAIHVQGTINGWGERCGNANLCAILPTLALKMNIDSSTAPHIQKITSVSRFVAEKANIIPDKRQPYVGEAAFSHKAGQHADVLSKADYLMEHINAKLVGNERRILLSELAGKSTVLDKLSKYGTFEKNSEEVESLIQILKDREVKGYEYEAAEASFDLLIRKTLKIYKPLMELNNYHLESYKTWESPSKTVGRIFLRINGKDVMGAAVGVGPVETLDAALRNAIEHFYPFIKDISLTDYKVRVLNPETAGTAAKVRVFISFTDHHQNTWDTVGVSENIVEASWEALVDSLDYYYNTFIVS